MIQQLGQQNGFDVDIWDPNINGSPGRQAPAGVSLTTSPFLDLNTLKQYKTIVFDSTVGRDGTSTVNAAEFANLQAYIRGGGGFVGIHGAADSMQDVPWYQDLVGAGFTDHGSNSNGGILADTGAGGSFQLDTADPAHASMAQVPPHFFTVDEAYNTNRNPVDMGLVHPLQYENEESVIGQIGYSPGAIMNSDNHAMTWCHNFDGGRAYTTVLGHSWVYATDNWFRVDDPQRHPVDRRPDVRQLRHVQRGQGPAGGRGGQRRRDPGRQHRAQRPRSPAPTPPIAPATTRPRPASRSSSSRRPRACRTSAPTVARRCCSSSPRAPSSSAG